jgi:hypothetical protein
MTLDWLYQLSSWNPQLARELKGRLTPRVLGVEIAASLVLQGVVMLYCASTLPDVQDKVHQYCTGKSAYSYSPVERQCLHAAGQVLINWKLWWTNLYYLLSWALPFVVLIAGVYLLIGDLGKEEKRGTLNFIRLSPQTSESILLGKVLGVPIVPYVAVLMAVPLHLLAAIAGGVPLGYVLSTYLLTVGICGCFFIGSLLFAFMGGFQGWIGAIAVLFGYNLVGSIFVLAARSSSSVEGEVRHFGLGHWYGLLIGAELWMALPFLLVTFGMAIHWLWTAANRRFRNPNISILSKAQSYLATASFALWMIGFTVRDRGEYDPLTLDLTFVGMAGIAWVLLLVAALTPHRQTVLDWTRYRRQNLGQTKQAGRSQLLADLLWGEKSPALVAIAVNLAIVALPYVLRVVLEPNMGLKDPKVLLAGLVFGILYVLMCAAITQLMLMLKTNKRAAWAIGIIAAVTFLPPTVLGATMTYPTTFALAWMLAPASAIFAVWTAPLMEIFWGMLVQVSVLGLLTARLTRQMHKMGESEMKALLAAARV